MAQHRIALIGLGMAVTPHAKSLLDLASRAEVVHAFSPSQERRAAFAKSFRFPLADTLDRVLADKSVTAIGILTPPNTHLELVRKAAAAGKHILLEKPLETSTARAEEVVAAARSAGVTLGICLQHRFRPAGARLAAVATCSAASSTARPRSGCGAHRAIATYRGAGTKARDGGGVLLNQGIHTLDLMLSVAGPVREVKGYAVTSAVHRMETEDMVVAAVRFANGVLGVIDATTAAYPGFPERIEIIGERGTAALVGNSLAVEYQDGRREEMKPDGSPGGTGADPMAFPHDWHLGVWTDFLDVIETERNPRISGEEALKVHRLIDALIAAGATGQTVEVAGTA